MSYLCSKPWVSGWYNVSLLAFRNSSWWLYWDFNIKSRLSFGASGSKWNTSLRDDARVTVVFSLFQGSSFWAKWVGLSYGSFWKKRQRILHFLFFYLMLWRVRYYIFQFWKYKWWKVINLSPSSYFQMDFYVHLHLKCLAILCCQQECNYTLTNKLHIIWTCKC